MTTSKRTKKTTESVLDTGKTTKRQQKSTQSTQSTQSAQKEGESAKKTPPSTKSLQTTISTPSSEPWRKFFLTATNPKNGTTSEYHFSITAEKSELAGAGQGAFLTYLGGSDRTDRGQQQEIVTFPGKSLGRQNITITLGNYGSTDDLVPEHIFEVKNFIFSNEPGEWAYACSTKGYAVDITDSYTGSPKDEEKGKLLLYINERGHETKNRFKVNVECDAKDSLRYDFVPRTDMEKGKKVELVMDYGEFYEAIRVRKGYGKENRSGLTEPDSNFRCRYERNEQQRKDITKKIELIDACSFGSLIKYLTDLFKHLRFALSETLDIQTETETKTTVQQAIAFRRLSWLIPHLLNRYTEIRKDLAHDLLNAEIRLKVMDKIQCHLWDNGLLDYFQSNKDLTDSKQIKFSTYIQLEMYEEVLFDLADWSVFDYCKERQNYGKRSRVLIEAMCLHIGRSEWTQSHYITSFKTQNLVNAMLHAAHASAEGVKSEGVNSEGVQSDPKKLHRQMLYVFNKFSSFYVPDDAIEMTREFRQQLGLSRREANDVCNTSTQERRKNRNGT